jgi:predicted RNA binding protein YcfA (HicA-like mRNA interferase family)
VSRKDHFQYLKENPKNIRFEEFFNIIISFGFSFKGGKGSHRVFAREGIPTIMTIQNCEGKAKPYQVRQFCKIIELYNLME